MGTRLLGRSGGPLASANLLELGHVGADDGGAEELKARQLGRFRAVVVLDEYLDAWRVGGGRTKRSWGRS